VIPQAYENVHYIKSALTGHDLFNFAMHLSVSCTVQCLW